MATYNGVYITNNYNADKRLKLSDVYTYYYNIGTMSNPKFLVKSYLASSMGTSDNRLIRYSGSSSSPESTLKYNLYVCDSKVHYYTSGYDNYQRINKLTRTFDKVGYSKKEYGINEVIPVYPQSLKFSTRSPGTINNGAGYTPITVAFINSFSSATNLGASDSEAHTQMLNITTGAYSNSPYITGNSDYSTLSNLWFNAKVGNINVPQCPLTWQDGEQIGFGAIDIAYVYIEATIDGTSSRVTQFKNSISSSPTFWNCAKVFSYSSNSIRVDINAQSIPTFAYGEIDTSNHYLNGIHCWGTFLINKQCWPIKYILANIYFETSLKSYYPNQRLYPARFYSSSGSSTNVFYDNPGTLRYSASSSNYISFYPKNIDIVLKPNKSKIYVGRNYLATGSNAYIHYTSGLASNLTYTDLCAWGNWRGYGSTQVNVKIYSEANPANYIQYCPTNPPSQQYTTYNNLAISDNTDDSSRSVDIYFRNDSSNSGDVFEEKWYIGDTRNYTYWWFIDINRASGSSLDQGEIKFIQ